MYICANCQSEYKKWYGQCPKCKEWNTIAEGKAATIATSKTAKPKQVLSLDEIDLQTTQRFKSGNSQLDLVLGGGFVPGSLTLLGGRPGIGKSTLLLAVANYLAQTKRVLYVSGEESLGQIKLRAKRLQIKNDIRFLNEQNSHDIIATSLKNKVQFLILDSIQTTASPNVNAVSGSVSQLKSIALEMMEFAKQNNITVLLIGHVTKDGDIAGPKLLEHMVDTVIYIESNDNLRLLRAEKNRFGTTSEVGILTMQDSGLNEYKASSISGNLNQQIEGASFGGVRVGGRQLQVQIESLISASAYPSPKRSSQGIELARVNIMLAIIQKHLNLMVNYDDVYVKLASNIRRYANDLDLALLVSLYSAKTENPISSNILFVGEVTLTGKILSSDDLLSLATAAGKLGFKQVIANCQSQMKCDGIEIIDCKDVNSVINIVRR